MTGDTLWAVVEPETPAIDCWYTSERSAREALRVWSGRRPGREHKLVSIPRGRAFYPRNSIYLPVIDAMEGRDEPAA